MSYNCCSGNFSSRSLGGYLCSPGSSWGSPYPSNLVYSTDLCSPSTCQLGSSLSRGCQETCCEPTRCLTSCVVSGPCQVSCYHPRTSTLCSPCWSPFTTSLGYGSHRTCLRSYGSRSCYSLACGSSGFRPQSEEVRGFPFLSHGSQFCYPSYLTSRTTPSSCSRPTCGSNFC